MVKLARPNKNIFAVRPKGKEVTSNFPRNKGLYLGSCNRQDCLKPGADYYNHSTRKYYCAECADWLNSDPFNKRDAMELYGHDLCTKGRHIH